MVDAGSTEEVAAQRFFLKLSGVCALVGSIGFVLVGTAHGDLPDDDVAAALRFVADHPHWYLTHFAGIVCVLLWVVALMGLAYSLEGIAAFALGRTAVAAMGIGAAVFVVDYTIDGYAFKRIADQWAAAGPGDAEQLPVAETLFAMLYGTVTASATWTFGLPFLLIGLAVAVGRGYPRWLGWVVTVTGSGSVIGGVATYLAWHPSAGFVAALGFNAASTMWLAVMGVLMLRRARRMLRYDASIS
ncbi:hypothetical protein [Nocardia sp. CS682]|uniref:hypothetical protein n=1 Tax=Nocardia sp. CS682 TaxID=1047172 RepID=UPI0010754298|nr:hypothetical protein [Nocardia sp. CS682]